jgi:hypothetical protein
MSLTLFIVAVVLAVGYVSIQTFIRFRQKKQNDKQVSSLKEYGKVIDVAFDDCVVKTGQVSMEPGSGLPTEVEMVNGLFGKGPKGESVAEVSYVVYEWRKDGRMLGKFVSQPIFMPEETLRYKMEQTKTAKLYLDPNDSSRYLFDIMF